MPGPGDALFLALAQAKAQPDRWARAVNQAGEAGGDVLGGYVQGKQIQQQLAQYRLLNTPLGTMYSDPSQIPFGLSPQHTVKDLLTIAPAMENYAPANLMSGVANLYGANTNTNTNPNPDSRSGSMPSTASTPVPMPTPKPTLASTDMSSIPPGAESPAPTPGGANLNAIEGTGPSPSQNIPPPGSQITTLGGGTSTVPPAPTLNIPSGGMGMGAFQKTIIPALNAAREGRQFDVGQANENERAALTRQQQASQFATAQQNEKNRTMAGETAKIAPGLTEAGTIQDDINALMPLYKGYQPIPFVGSALANLAQKSGTTTFGGQTVQQGKQIQQIVPALSAKVNYLLNKRFNSGEAAMLQQQVVPNATDNEQSAMQKIGNLQRLTAVMQSGDVNALQMVANSIAGKPVRPMLPSSTGTSTNAIPSGGMVPPTGRITVKGPNGQIGHIPQNQLQAALQQGYVPQ